MLRSDRYFADATADAIGAEITAKVQEMVEINNALYASAEGDARLTARVDQWHASALAWMKAAPAAAQDEAKLVEWGRIGANIAANALDYANEIEDSTIAAQASAFIRGIPNSVSTVGSWLRTSAVSTVRAAGDVVNAGVSEAGRAVRGAGFAVGTTAVMLLAAVALGAYLLKKSGTKISAGPLSVG